MFPANCEKVRKAMNEQVLGKIKKKSVENILLAEHVRVLVQFQIRFKYRYYKINRY